MLKNRWKFYRYWWDICSNSSDLDYTKAKPIKKISKEWILFLILGIISHIGLRGTGTGINWYSVTIKQFKSGVKYHHLSLGEKPIFDLLMMIKFLTFQI